MKVRHETDLDPLLHQPVRTRIAAYLVTRGEVTFTELKQALAVTDGNLEAHLKKLTGAHYVSVMKNGHQGRVLTSYQLTAEGLTAFKNYVTSLKNLLPMQNAKL